MTDIKIIFGYNHLDEISGLFSEYTQLLIANDPTFQKYLDMQNYKEEVSHLEQKYGLPNGRIYLAYYKNQLAGCIGLRKIDNKNCEMKRLYVKSQFRGKQIGKKLIQKIIEDAKEIGYSYILLDTLPFLESAIHMYKQFGFYEIESYNNSPMENAIYMRLDLENRMDTKEEAKG